MKSQRNEKCPCGSGIKYKKCCLITERNKADQKRIADQIKAREDRDKRTRQRECELDNRRSPSLNLTAASFMMALSLSNHR
jgi:hypothetical protein